MKEVKKEVQSENVIVEFMCDSCDSTEQDIIDNLIYNGAPICMNTDCSDFQEEMYIFKVFVKLKQ